MATNRDRRMAGRKRKSRRQFPAPVLLLLGGVILVGAAMVWLIGGKDSDRGAKVPVEVSGQPSLKVDQEKLDFGDVKFNEPVTANFTLTNVGDKPLRFTKQPYIEVAAGC